MEIITQVKTLDGKVHQDERAARRHLESLHANLLASISRAVIQEGNGKYVATGNWIDENLNQFLELDRIKRDMVLINSQDD